MKRYTLLLTAGMSLLVAAPASAQYGGGEIVPSQAYRGIAVSDWSPKQGKPGTAITIRGSGFTRSTQVIFGGRRVRVTQSSGDTITFKVPDAYDDGLIILREQRGRNVRDVTVGTFSFAESAQITRFAPQSGVPGTRVEIVGAGFQQNDQIYIGNVALRIERVTPQRIVAVIPDGAQSDYLYVVAADGSRVRTPSRFDVLDAGPVILDVQPGGGYPDTVVRISGQNFGPNTKVFYGRRPLPIASQGNGWIDVRVPEDARDSDWFYLRDRSGEARSPQKFQLEQLPLISRFSPSSGAVGQRVDIYGRNFRPGDRVGFAGVWAEITQLEENRIIVRVPQGARSGPIVVRRGNNAQGVSSQEFVVAYGPVITGFSPLEGRPGTEVTITGQYFTPDAQVFYGNTSLRVFRRQGDSVLVVRIPRDATSWAPFRVRTRTGETVSAERFKAAVMPELTNMQPRQAYPGERVTLDGNLLDRVDSVLLDNTPLVIINKRPRRIIVEIPAGANDGWISLSAYGQVVRTEYRFQIVRGPECGDFYPASGRPGSEITINGHYFDQRTAAYLGQYQLQVVRWAENQLVVRLPDRINAGSWNLRVRSGNRESQSHSQYQVILSAYIASTSAAWVYAGNKFAVNGEYFDRNTRIYWGDDELKIGARSDRSLEVFSPRDVSGTKFLWIDDGHGRTQSQVQLEIRPNNRPGRPKRPG